MISSGLEYDLIGIGSQLKRTLLAVPAYQRPYSWDEGAVTDFWRDLWTALSRKAPEYFLGTVVLTRDGATARDTIIDGQQRLATTTMLFAAIRDVYAAGGDAARADILQNESLTISDLKSGTRVPRLRLGSDDDLFYRKRVIEREAVEPTRASHRRIKAAYEYLKERVDEVVKATGKEWSARLFELVEFFEKQARVIVLRVETEADAFLIFETLNDRGADLTIADLLKNYLFGRAGTQLDAVRDGWMQAVGALDLPSENGTFTMFLRQYWSSKKGTTRERELYSRIREDITSETHSVEFVDELQKNARLYAALLNSDHEAWAQLGTEGKKSVETFLRLDMEQVRPLMLAALQHFGVGEMRRLLRAITSWGVRGLITGGIGGGTYERAYCDAAVGIRKGDLKSTDDVFKKLERIVPTDDEFRTVFSVARVPRPGTARYLLLSLEKTNTGGTEPELVPNEDEQQVNLEHVLPKGATDAEWGAAFSAEERKEFLYRLGNMALLQKGPNGRIGNKAFSVKKPILALSTFGLTKTIGAEADWSPTAINARQVVLADLAIKTWQRKPV